MALALGIVSFAFVGLLGLLPAGMNANAAAADATLESQIAQSIVAQARQAKFSNLASLNAVSDSNPSNPTPDFFFDEQGQSSASTTAASYVYGATVQVFYNSSVPVGAAPADAGLQSTADNASMAVVKVTVCKKSASRDPYSISAVIANKGL